MPDIMVWLTQPGGESTSGLEDVGRQVEELGHVSWVDVRTEGSVVHLSFEGGRAEQEEGELAIREAGYEVFKVLRREA